MRISGGASAGRVAVRVADRGSGIPRRYRAQVFEPFFRGRGEAGAGSGLGLAICRGFVEANGGRIVLQTGTGHRDVVHGQLPGRRASRRDAVGCVTVSHERQPRRECSSSTTSRRSSEG